MKKKVGKNYNKNNLHQLKKTLAFTVLFCSIILIVVVISQMKLGDPEIADCSEFDPPLIDYISFVAALYLIVEGFIRIIEHKNETIPKQFTRMVRILFGLSIFIIHVMHFVKK